VALPPGALRRAREDAGLPLSLLGIRAEVSYSHLSAVEAGKEGISPAALARVCAALGITIAELRDKEPDGPTTSPGEHRP
jgi:transcriptional regulator with XRE-family HTH domain